ncbi:MAG: response regulator transcription factor [Bacteroidota bacterium]
MNSFRCLLVDDEPPAVDLLVKYIHMIDELEIVGKCHSAVKAFALLKQQPVDLLFLDIRMPILNGIDFLKTLQQPPAVILTTAYREYALDGYDLDIIDYLLKPIAFDRFLKAIDRFRVRRHQPKLTLSTPPPTTNDFLFFNVNKKHHKVYFKDLRYIESLKDYVRIHTVHQRMVVKGNLGMILDRFPDNLLIRIHRSFAVAVNFIDAYNQTEVEIMGVQLPIGGSYRTRFLEAVT